jgi:hypothetical protein
MARGRSGQPVALVATAWTRSMSIEQEKQLCYFSCLPHPGQLKFLFLVVG